MFLVMLMAAGIQAAAILPQSVTLESGNLKVRLDSRKFCFMNRIEWNNKIFCVDNSGSHYGTVFNIVGAKGFVGSGHIETGHKEQVESLTIMVDGKPVDYLKADAFKGEKIQVVKISQMRDFLVKYELTLADNQIAERSEITSNSDVELNKMYHFMHPWSTAFTDLFYRKANGGEETFEFRTDDKFPLREDAPTVAWYNRKTGDGVVTVVFPGEGQKNRIRLVWDTKRYRKDYIVDFRNSTFPKGHKAVYAVKTAFFSQPDAEKWIADAKAIAIQLENK